MDKARDARSDYGAADSEPRGVVKDIVESYLELIFDEWDERELFDTVDGW